MTAIALARTAALTVNRSQTAPSREQQFNQLIATYMDDLYRYAYWLAGNGSVADDLVQETLLRAWKAMDKLQAGNRVEAFRRARDLGWL